MAETGPRRLLGLAWLILQLPALMVIDLLSRHVHDPERGCPDGQPHQWRGGSRPYWDMCIRCRRMRQTLVERVRPRDG